MKTLIFNISLFVALCLQSLNISAQNDAAMLEQSIKNDSAINAIALYPLELRNSILKVCGEPQGLLKMESLQKNSKERFRKILSAYPQEEQKKLWDLTRYPGLVEKLVKDGDGKKRKIEPLLKDFPKDIHETALTYGVSHHKTLESIDNLEKSIQSDFAEIIKTYPPEQQTAFRDVLGHPEVIDLLGKNMHMTVLWGDVHKRNPQLVKTKLDALGTDLAAKNAKSLKDWKEGLEKDPEAKKEFEESAKEYAKEQGYSDDELIVNNPNSINVYVHPYPYWYGTPWWWDYPRWYPYPYWYDWGYYYGPYGVVYIGYPSWYFTNWYFYNPYHHHNHPHFSDYCIDHYYGHRSSYTPVHRTVSGWVNDNQNRLPSDFVSNKSQRVERLREFGKFEQDYKKEMKTVPDRMSKDQFLKENADRYPSLKQPAERIKAEPKNPDKDMGPVKPIIPDKEIVTPSPEPRIKTPESQPKKVNPSSPNRKMQPQPRPQQRQPQMQKPAPMPKQQAPRGPRKGGG